MTKLDKELLAFRDREHKIEALERELETARSLHRKMTKDAFGIASGELATVDGMVLSVQRIVKMMSKE